MQISLKPATALLLAGAALVSGIGMASPASAAPANTRSAADPVAPADASDTASFVPFVFKDGGSYWAVTSQYWTTVAKPTWEEASELSVKVTMPVRGGGPAPIRHEVNDDLCFGAPADTTVEYTFGYDNCTNPFRLDADGKLYRVFGQWPQRVGVQGQGQLLGGNIGNSTFVGDQPDLPTPSRKPVITGAEQIAETNNIQLTWTGVAGATWWVIERDGIEVGQARDAVSYLDKRVPTGKHVYVVRPYWQDQAEASDPYTVDVEDFVSPSPVQDLAVAAVSRHGATLQWREPAVGAVADYLVEIAGREPVAVHTTTVTLSDLEAGVPYTASLTARNPDAQSSPRTVTFETVGVQRLVSGWASTGNGFYALTVNTDGTVGYSNPFSTAKEAAAAATDVVLPDEGAAGRIRDTHGNCLVVPKGSNQYARFVPCAEVSDEFFSTFTLTPGGRLAAANGEYLAFVWNGTAPHAVLKPGSTTYFTVMDRP